MQPFNNDLSNELFEVARAMSEESEKMLRGEGSWQDMDVLAGKRDLILQEMMDDLYVAYGSSDPETIWAEMKTKYMRGKENG